LARLILKVVVFIIVGGLLLFPICYLSRVAYLNSLNDKIFSLPKETTTLIVGDSHPQVSVNPKLISGSRNIASSAENYFYTYYKLKHFLNKNPQITTVILGFSWHNFPQNYQESFLFSESRSNIENYYLLLDEEGKSIVKNLRSSYLVPWLRYSFGVPMKLYLDKILSSRLLGNALTPESIDFFGGYKMTTKSVIDKKMTNEKLKVYFSDDHGSYSQSSPIMMEYLNKILKLCSGLNVKVVLLNTPVHVDYRSGVPNQSESSFEVARSNIIKKYSNVLYVDYSDYRLPTNCFYDGDHINTYGAEIVTKAIKVVLGVE